MLWVIVYELYLWFGSEELDGTRLIFNYFILLHATDKLFRLNVLSATALYNLKEQCEVYFIHYRMIKLWRRLDVMDGDLVECWGYVDERLLCKGRKNEQL